MSGERILLVDDDRLVRNAVARRLREYGHDVTQAGDGKQALALLRVTGHHDIVISDWEMPKMDGLTLMLEIQTRYPHMRRLLMSGAADLTKIDEALDCSIIHGFWSKLDHTEALLDLLSTRWEIPIPPEPEEEPEGVEDQDTGDSPPEEGVDEGILPEPIAIDPVEKRLTRSHIAIHMIEVMCSLLRYYNWEQELIRYVQGAKGRTPTDRERRWVKETVISMQQKISRKRKS